MDTTTTQTLTLPVTELKKGDRYTHEFTGGPTTTVKRVQAYSDTVVVWWVEGNHTVFTHPRHFGVKPVTVERKA